MLLVLNQVFVIGNYSSDVVLFLLFYHITFSHPLSFSQKTPKIKITDAQNVMTSIFVCNVLGLALTHTLILFFSKCLVFLNLLWRKHNVIFFFF